MELLPARIELNGKSNFLQDEKKKRRYVSGSALLFLLESLPSVELFPNLTAENNQAGNEP